ncbi:MAG: AAA family ATPase [Candidatus Odinarchaeota archaeon]
MILSYLEMKNIRSYDDEKIHFPPGTTLFSGDIGSGKSSILMAIEFSLFGLGNQNGGSLLRLGTKNGSTTLRFKLNGEEYEIHRTLVKKRKSIQQGEAYLKSSQGTEHLSVTELKERVLDILQFREPPDPKANTVIYRYAVFTPQEEMKAVLKLKPADRLQTLRKAFGIEDYKITQENARNFSRAAAKKVDYLEGQVSDLNKKKKEQDDSKKLLSEHEKKLAEFEIKQIKALEYHNELVKEKKELTEEEKRLKEIEGAIPQVEKQISDKTKQIADVMKDQRTIQEELDSVIVPKIKRLEEIKKPTDRDKKSIKAEIKNLRDLENKKNVLEGKISTLETDVGKLNAKVANYNYNSLNDVDADIKTIRDKLEKTPEELVVFRENLDRAIKDIATSDAQIKDIGKKIEDLEGVGSLCPFCNQKLTDEHKKVLEEERRNRILELKGGKKTLEQIEKDCRNKIKSTEETAKALQEKMKELETARKNLSDFFEKTEQLKKCKEEVGTINSQIIVKEEVNFPVMKEYSTPLQYLEALLEQLDQYNSAQDDLKTLNAELAKKKETLAERSKKHGELSIEKDTLERKLAEAKGEFKKLEKVSKRVSELDDLIKKSQAEKEQLGNDITATRTNIDNLNENIKKLGNEIEEKEKQQASREKLADYCHWLDDFFIPTLDSIEKHVMININQDFNDNFQRWFNILVIDVGKTVRVDEEFTPIIEQEGYDQDVDFLSGGEKTSVALAYRLALNDIVKKVSTGMKSNLLILDEPTDGFSKEQLFKVREILQELQCPQVILVSHERELEGFADNVFRVEKTDGKSSIQLTS